jgi:hypothetical protein
MRMFVRLALTTALLAPLAIAQKPPAPTPQPPAAPPPSHSPTPDPTNKDPSQPRTDQVVFLLGRIATSDGTPVPSDALVERICNNKVRQQVHPSARGDFSMELGSRTDTFVDASGDPGSQAAQSRKDPSTGISKRELMNCELQASVRGFHSPVVSLVDLDSFGGRMDVGVILVKRGAKPDGMTLSAAPYKAPPDARKAYEKGLEAEKKANLAAAQKFFQSAVDLYPKYTSAWFALGNVLQKENQTDAARQAYTRATTIDSRFLPPYLQLASLAYQEKNWPVLLTLSDHILEHDPLNPTYATSYIVDLDSVNTTEAYFYNAVANYWLNNLQAA